MPRPIEGAFAPGNKNQRLAQGERRLRRLERRGAGPWHYVGQAGEPAFQNGWANVGGSLQSLRFRYSLSGGTDIEGSIVGGASGTVVFSLPVGYYDPSGEVRLPAVDEQGNSVAIRIVPATSPTRADVYVVYPG